MVLKPASQTPLSALALGELALRAGVPAGVFNVVTGAAQAIGTELCHNDLVRKITFTGSTEVGAWLSREAAGTIKKLSLELGGNAPFIVFDDADTTRRRRRTDVEVPQQRPDLRVRQPHLRTGHIYDDFAPPGAKGRAETGQWHGPASRKVRCR